MKLQLMDKLPPKAFKRTKFLLLLEEFEASGAVCALVTKDNGDPETANVSCNIKRAIKRFGFANTLGAISVNKKTYLVRKEKDNA